MKRTIRIPATYRTALEHRWEKFLRDLLQTPEFGLDADDGEIEITMRRVPAIRKVAA